MTSNHLSKKEQLADRDGARCECGSLMMNIKYSKNTWSVCSDGCGKLKPPLDKDHANRNAWLLAYGFPDAIDHGYGFVIHGQEGIWRKVDDRRLFNRPPAKGLPDLQPGDCWALIGPKCHAFRKR